MRIAVCIPVHGDTKAEFTLNLGAMLIGEARNHSLNLHMASGSVLPKIRNDLAEQALAGSPDYLLWMDSDHVFPPSALNELLARKVEVVGCNFMRRNGGRTSSTKAGKDLAHGSGIEAVDTVGLGICLMKASLFASVPKPWFAFNPLPDGSMTGEDEFFFGRLYGATGIRPHVDHDLSARCGHIASKVLFLTG